VQALDILGAAAQPVEPVAPFGPATPLTRPPRKQSRLVVLVLAVLVIVLGVLAVIRFIDFDPAPLLTGSGDPSPVATTSAGSTAGTAPTSSAPARGAAAPVRVVGVTAIDPQGDGNENGDLARTVIDRDASTSWHSERYDSPGFGGIKKGLGLVLDLGSATTVTSVTVRAPGSDGALQLRTSEAGDSQGDHAVASGRLTGSGRVLLRPAQPASTRYLVLWFTRVPQNDGGRRIIVTEVVVR
jgi:hypothetical protein